MALGLCASAAAAFQVDGLAQGQTGYLAGYDDAGRMVGLRVLDADGQVDAMDDAVSYKLLRTDENTIPQGPALAFSPDKAVVRKVEGQVLICYGSGQGLAVTQPVTEKATGKVTFLGRDGTLLINDTTYPATELTVEGCDMPISPEDFQNWSKNGGSFSATYDFYLDPQGAICWIEQLTESDHSLCLPLTAVQEEGQVRVLVRLSAAETDVLTVSRLDGKAIGDGPDCISAADAVAQIEADRERAFYSCGRRLGNSYHLVRAGKDAPVDTGFATGENYVIPEGSAVQPDADFSFGAVPCKADENTLFWIAVGSADKTYQFRRGFQELPFAQAKGCVLTDKDGVADIVYLDIPYFAVEPPGGCILVADNIIQLNGVLLGEEVYRINVVDVDGSKATLRVLESIVRDVHYDSMRLDRLDSNAYAGKLWQITAMDQDGVALALQPVETHALQALGDHSITTAAGTWAYDVQTRFVHVDLGWQDDQDDDANMIGVREPDKDLWCIWEYGPFPPNNFFNPAEVGPEEDKPYSSVRAAVIPADDDETLAQYVYIIRTCN